jgi:hypothetical protein
VIGPQLLLAKSPVVYFELTGFCEARFGFNLLLPFLRLIRSTPDLLDDEERYKKSMAAMRVLDRLTIGVREDLFL